jgi:molybdopterin synthase sulfur carrier subunit
MKLKVLYFASLREAVGCSEEELALPAGVASVGGLRAHLAARGERWQALAPLAAGDEVAFFPPVTGG